jgi:nucleoid-associated protein YgaU
MTRENKLALVVGFGLILFVGILISDHFSTVRRQQAAHLRQEVVDPLMRADARLDTPQELVDLLSQAPAGRSERLPAANLDQLEAPAATEAQAAPTHVEMGTALSDEVLRSIGLPPSSTSAASGENRSGRFHSVASGQSLSRICVMYYGDESLTRDLARYNGIDDPNLVTIGHRLRIPDAAELVRGTAEPANRPRAARTAATVDETPAARDHRSYRVKKGDSLSEIAQRLTGSARKWRQILELNSDVIEDPDVLVTGTVLKIPTN